MSRNLRGRFETWRCQLSLLKFLIVAVYLVLISIIAQNVKEV
jgi:hypothetical protein